MQFSRNILRNYSLLLAPSSQNAPIEAELRNLKCYRADYSPDADAASEERRRHSVLIARGPLQLRCQQISSYDPPTVTVKDRSGVVGALSSHFAARQARTPKILRLSVR